MNMQQKTKISNIYMEENLLFDVWNLKVTAAWIISLLIAICSAGVLWISSTAILEEINRTRWWPLLYHTMTGRLFVRKQTLVSRYFARPFWTWHILLASVRAWSDALQLFCRVFFFIFNSPPSRLTFSMGCLSVVPLAPVWTSASQFPAVTQLLSEQLWLLPRYRDDVSPVDGTTGLCLTRDQLLPQPLLSAWLNDWFRDWSYHGVIRRRRQVSSPSQSNLEAILKSPTDLKTWF